MAVDPTWLESVRAAHRQKLGLSGRGMGDASSMLSPFGPPPPPPSTVQLAPPVERPWIKKVVYVGAGIAVLGIIGSIAVSLWPSGEVRS